MDRLDRCGEITRKTKETDIKAKLIIDGSGQADICTGIGFFDHMLEGFTKHGLFDMNFSVKGDLQVDTHHSIEDAGIVLGQAIKQAVGDKAGIKRYGSMILPMDETLVICSIDLCGRPYFVYDLTFDTEMVGEFPTEMCREFFYAVSYAAEMNLHIRQISGSNSHHIIEAAFKAFGHALDEATTIDPRITGVNSTKSVL